MADLGGCRGRTLPPTPGRPNSFDFMQFSGKFGKIVCWRPPPPPPQGVGAPPPPGKSWIRRCFLQPYCAFTPTCGPISSSLHVFTTHFYFNILINLHMSLKAHSDDSITITCIDGTFELFDGHCDGQNGLHTHFAHQHNIIAWYEWTLNILIMS